MLAFFKSANVKALQPPASTSCDEQTASVSVKDIPDAEPQAIYARHDSTPADAVERPSTTTVTVPGSTNLFPVVSVTPHDVDYPQTPVEPMSIPLPDSPNPATSLTPAPATHVADTMSVACSEPVCLSSVGQSPSQVEQPYLTPGGKDFRPFSFLSLPFIRSDAKLAAQPQRKSAGRSLPVHAPSHMFSGTRLTGKKSRVRTFSVYSLRPVSTEKRAKESATVVRSIIVGDPNTSDGKLDKARAPTRSKMARVKSQLLKPKSASKVIAQLRTLPAEQTGAPVHPNIPIRAVCLDVSDAEAHERYFSKLGSVASAPIESLLATLADVHIIDLLVAPNMGFGAPVTAQGLFAGAVPTAEAVLEGIQQVTPQLLALGYATGKAILPDHKGIIVPPDRISILTYWWGFEVCLPPPTLAHIQSAAAPCSALLNLLTALSVLNEGVREVLPFIRYLAQFVEMEWHSIRAADEGKGVVCCATWILPAALVPRAWDFPDPPRSSESPSSTPQSPVTANPATATARLSTAAATAKASTDGVPRVSSAFSEVTCEDDEVRPIISSEPPILPELVVSSPSSIEEEPEPVDGNVYTIPDEIHRETEAIVL
ncbi:hypothetical protein ID866_1995 [Astraeus odoratus]|nr:hypothetical protein ID866_1995 [Astraeus odoratus]